MKAMWLASAMALAMVGNTQAGWFGLTEDYPFKNDGADRTTFISSALEACITKSRNGQNPWALSSKQILYVCNCRARKLADVITKTEFDYISANKKYPDKFLLRVAKFDTDCLQDMIDDGK
jgi:hypothetical protein